MGHRGHFCCSHLHKQQNNWASEGRFCLAPSFLSPTANIQDEMRLRNFFWGMQAEAELPQVAPTPDQSAFILLRLFGPNNEQQKQTARASGR